MSVWDDAPIVEVCIPRCPTCGAHGSKSYVPIRGTVDADGGRTSKRICKRCSSPYIVLALLPDSGKDTDDD
jgi:hypothetical protein